MSVLASIKADLGEHAVKKYYLKYLKNGKIHHIAFIM
jgi:hypothetical protein